MINNRFSKIVATIGPATKAPSNLELLIDVGVNAFRLNFSHGSHDDHAKVITNLRRAAEHLKTSICIIADMQGPKLRIGELMGGKMELQYGQTVQLVQTSVQTDADTIPINHPELFSVLAEGHILKIDDGKLQLTIAAIHKNKVEATVNVPGLLTNRKGINLIGAALPVSAMTDKDKIDMHFALDKGVDYIALSFVQSVKDVIDAREIIGTKAGIIVKIEKPSALDELEDIIDAADGVMVARGDLGVELPLEDVPIVQRRIIRLARSKGKPVIVATHMLESMVDNPTPTRAEASDVATAIYQGADAVMLSAETAVGRHPATAVAIMDRIIRAAESDPEYWDGFKSRPLLTKATYEDAISHSARSIAEITSCRAVFGFTATGSTVSRLSRERPPCRIIGMTPYETTARRLVLYWGVTPHIMSDPDHFDAMVTQIQEKAQNEFGIEPGETILITSGIPFGRPGTTDTLKIATIEST